MWFIGKSILAYLIRNDIKDKEREKLIKKTNLIKLEINKLKDEELIDYFLNPKLPDEIKRLISEKFTKLKESCFSTDNKRFKIITDLFKSKKIFTEKQLKLDYYPNEFKNIIIDNLYKDTAVNLIKSNTIPLNIKTIIIDIKLSRKEAIELLGSNISKNLKDIILDLRINSDQEIGDCVDSRAIPDDLKKEIIITKINKNNILGILKWTYFERKELVMELKSKELEEIIEEQTSENILSLINDYNTPISIINKLFDSKLDIITEAIKTNSKNTIKETLRREINTKIVELILTYRNEDIIDILKKVDEYEILSFLNLKYLPLEYKELIINEHESTIERKINKLSKTEIDLYYVKKDSNLPLKIQTQIINQRKEDFIKEIKNDSEENIIRCIKNSTYIKPITELIIDLRVNENILFELLGNNYTDESSIDLLISKKNDLIIKYLDKLDPLNIFKLNGKKYLSNYAKNKIIEVNKNYYLDKIANLTIKEKYKILNDFSTIETCKKLILESLNIKDVDLNVCLDLLKQGNVELILENFNKIKEFITSSNISFESFLQYGSGSQKHKNWINNIINIINNDKEKFIECKNYFFNNYYEEDNEKENTVYIISNYLELIENYEKYKELCISLTNQNKELSKEDKLNISFLFNLNNIIDIDLPTTLEELNEFKTKIYKKYVDIITNSSTTKEQIKEIFNNLILCNSNTILKYIGGTKTLKTLKKDNQNSNTILNLTDELINYSILIEMINDTNNIEGLKKILEYIFKDINTLTKLQNLFSEFEKKVTKLFELDSKNNLTTLERNKNVEGVLNRELSSKYGGEVFDYSDKNYVLYAHVLSSRENIENVINGVADGKNNFISLSPISYKGQKYYWDRREVIFAYDKIPNGSFVCSSINNMGSNNNIINNSSEVEPIKRMQRGILETSAVTKNNSEALLYREGLKPCGLILPGGREPTKKELEYHQKYNLPFIITQEKEKAIENPKMVLKRAEDKKIKSIPSNELESIKQLLIDNIKIQKENDCYTGKEIALITDCHSMYEPTLAVLEDIRRNGIDEIYSLGDNIGVGPNPKEVFDLLEEYGVISIAGNSEYYCTLGTKPFPYFTEDKEKSQIWTEEQLGRERIKKLRLYPASIDIILGNKKIALCHFANDVRWDFREQSTHTYQANYKNGNAAKQFLYTNSEESNNKVKNTLNSHKKATPEMRGYQSSKDNPIFEGKRVTDYDAIIQGHVHFDMDDKIEDTDIYTLRAVGMGYGKDNKNEACYYVLKEKKDNTFEIEKRLIEFNRNSLLSSIHTTDIPNKQLILRFVD